MVLLEGRRPVARAAITSSAVLPDEHYPVDTLKSTMVRFFPGIHLRESKEHPKEAPKWTKPP